MQVTFTETAKPKIILGKISCGYWFVERSNGLKDYNWGGTLSFHKSWEAAWRDVFGVSPR